MPTFTVPVPMAIGILLAPLSSEVIHRSIVNLLGQYYPGTSRYANDTPHHWEAWFQHCLHALAQVVPARASIGFPWRIGCGAAGGNWDHYQVMINQFAQQNPTYHVRIYQNE